jgi:predicted fused transcriptional regulator/phosphomethylpyrimidine kinase
VSIKTPEEYELEYIWELYEKEFVITKFTSEMLIKMHEPEPDIEQLLNLVYSTNTLREFD